MARKPRVRARSGVYHVLMQGVRHRDIYIDDEDYRTFVEILARLQKSKDDQVLVMLYDMTKTTSMIEFLGLTESIKEIPVQKKLDWDFFVL